MPVKKPIPKQAPRQSRRQDPFVLSGGGAAGATARSVDWARTPLGPVESWPISLKTTVGTVMHSRHPMFLWWGPELVQIYNDAYLPSFGSGKHPAAMGQRGADCWQEIWPIIWPQIDDVMSRGFPSWNVDQMVPILRNGALEEVYWTYGYSPVFDDSGDVGGTLVVCTETTARVLSDRRGQSLNRLTKELSLAEDSKALLSQALKALEEAPHDVPFVLAYLTDPKTRLPMLVGNSGLSGAALDAVDAAVRRGAQTLTVAGVIELGFETDGVVAGPWPEPLRHAFVEPMGSSNNELNASYLALGLSPRLAFDSSYRDYCSQISDTLKLARANLESLRMRAAAEAERRNLLEQAPVATALLLGPDHVFEVANPLYCKLVGRNNLVGKTYLQALPELADTPVYAVLDKVFQTGVPFVTNEYLVPMDKGTGTIQDGYYKFNIEPLRDVGGVVYGMMAVAVDITELVIARRTMEAAHLERERLLVALEAANSRKDEFLALLGHELRNPLAPIATAVQLMKLRGDQSVERERQVIERQVAHISRLVDDLLDVSRIARGKIGLRPRPLEIAEVLVKSIEMAGPVLEKRSHQLEVNVPVSGLGVSGDAVRLAQVFANLLTNAAKYTPEGGHISLTAACEDGQVVVRVKDDGVGIAPELLPSVFELFVQGPRSFDRGEGGLGLGLSLVKSLVTLHGGSVEAVSAGEGCGSEFIVRLNLEETPPAAAAPLVSPAAHAPRDSKRVLIVDDNVDAADLLADVLRLNGHHVKVAHDGAEALTILGSFRAEVFVLDLGLPVMDGFELARRIRAMELGYPIRLLALTGYGQENDLRRSHDAGFELHLVKPVSLEDVVRAVDGN